MFDFPPSPGLPSRYLLQGGDWVLAQDWGAPGRVGRAREWTLQGGGRLLLPSGPSPRLGGPHRGSSRSEVPGDVQPSGQRSARTCRGAAGSPCPPPALGFGRTSRFLVGSGLREAEGRRKEGQLCCSRLSGLQAWPSLTAAVQCHVWPRVTTGHRLTGELLKATD